MSFKFVALLVLVFTNILLNAASILDDIIDTECHYDDDCKEFERREIANATCIKNRCLCRDYHSVEVTCLPQKNIFSNGIGGKCPCSDINWSNCINGICMCDMDFVTSSDKRKCLPKKVPIGNTCENTAQCSRQTPFTKCINHTCSCSPDFTLHNGSCQSLVGLGKTCNSHYNHSAIPNAICVNDEWICDHGFVAKLDKAACLPNVEYNEGCLESVQCQEKLGLGGLCELGKCVCNEDFVNVTVKAVNGSRTTCDNKIAIGQLCSDDMDCIDVPYNGTELSMKCFRSECHCEYGFEEDNRNSRYCIKSKIAPRENTLFDNILMAISGSFTSNSGNRYSSKNSLVAVACFGVVILLS